jgi:N-acetylglucosamine-6-sulfatase
MSLPSRLRCQRLDQPRVPEPGGLTGASSASAWEPEATASANPEASARFNGRSAQRLTRASFLTGQHAHNHGVFSHKKPYGYGSFDDSRTLATSLSAAGYRTGFVGKYLNGFGPARSLVSDKPSWRYRPQGWGDWIAAFENPGVRGIRGGTYNHFNTPYDVNGKVDNRYKGEYNSDTIGRFSVNLAKRYQSEPAPFFMYVNYVAPHHGPREPGDPGRVRRSDGKSEKFVTAQRPDSVRGMFDDRIKRAPVLRAADESSEADMSDRPPQIRSRPELTADARAALLEVSRQRAEAIYVMDRNVGSLVSELKRSGEWSNTVFMVTSDDGYFLGEHRVRTGKVKAYEPSLRVPLIVTGPGLAPGSERYDPISIIDMFATILDIADAKQPREADGVSRLRTLTDGDQGWESAVLTEGVGTGKGGDLWTDDPRSSIGLRTARYSMTIYRTGFRELYDLTADPAQDRNVAADPTYTAIMAALTEHWKAIKDCAGAECSRPLAKSLAATVGEER